MLRRHWRPVGVIMLFADLADGNIKGGGARQQIGGGGQRIGPILRWRIGGKDRNRQRKR